MRFLSTAPLLIALCLVACAHTSSAMHGAYRRPTPYTGNFEVLRAAIHATSPMMIKNDTLHEVIVTYSTLLHTALTTSVKHNGPVVLPYDSYNIVLTHHNGARQTWKLLPGSLGTITRTPSAPVQKKSEIKTAKI